MNQAATHRVPTAVACACVLLLSACSKEPPPRTVVEFVENPRLLEATVVRCAQNRNELRYTQECVNAREAVDRIAATEEAARREELEAQSERKREALRRAQQAAVAARQRAAEAERLREEAEYLGQFEDIDPLAEPLPEGGAPQEPGVRPVSAGEVAVDDPEPSMPPVEEAPAAGSLESVRDELQRRQQADGQQGNQ
jgi:hypothetical protein